MASVVLADDHPLFLKALKAAVLDAGIDVVGTATRGDELVELLDEVSADAALIDLDMPAYDGFYAIEHLIAKHPELRVIVVSGVDDETSVRRALDAGAVCFIGKSIDPTDLAYAVKALLSGSVHLDSGLRRDPGSESENGSPTHTAGLTRRELEIIRLVADGQSNRQMARQLWVTEQTVKFHLSNIYRKIEVRNRTEASRWAHQHGLLEQPVTK